MVFYYIPFFKLYDIIETELIVFFHMAESITNSGLIWTLVQ